jgi:DNA-binding response OmpR family regulator
MTRVLIVEDEESFADPLAFLLRKEGFTTAVAGTGQDALEEFDRNGADIVLLDLMLPGMSSSPASARSCVAAVRAARRSTACPACWRPARCGWTSSGTSCR